MSLWTKIKPPQPWKLPVVLVVGSMVGVGGFILKESKALSYMSDDPKTCINCHVMMPEYTTWHNSSHGEVTTCNDCHVPHDNVFSTYAFKAKDGLYHAAVYTLRMEPQAIVMHEAGQEVVQDNCVRCHQDQVLDPKTGSWVHYHEEDRTARQCWECHREVPHGRVKSLSSVGYQVEPMEDRVEQEAILPEWIEENMTENQDQHEH